MHIAIDDTYGPETEGQSRYVTGKRRTHVGVVFRDDEVNEVRQQMAACLEFASELLGTKVEEFHFTDIYNRKKQWAKLKGDENLAIFGAFAAIYSQHRWPIELQTIDDRTFKSHPNLIPNGRLDGLDLSNRSDLALIFLCFKIKQKYAALGEPLQLLIDQGRGRPGRTFGRQLFSTWPAHFDGRYVSSKEPLIQIADLIAYCVNRTTILQLKEKRTETDTWFLHMVGGMGLNSPDLKANVVRKDFTVNDFDESHRLDRIAKGIE